MKKPVYLIVLISIIAISCKKDETLTNEVNPTAYQESNQEWGGEHPESVIRTLSCEMVPVDVSPWLVMDCSCWYPAYDCLPTFEVSAPTPPEWISYADAVSNGTTHAYFGTPAAINFFDDLTSAQLTQLQDSSIGFIVSPESNESGAYFYIAAEKAAIAAYQASHNCNESTMDEIEYADCFFTMVEEMKSNGEIVVVIPAREE